MRQRNKKKILIWILCVLLSLLCIFLLWKKVSDDVARQEQNAVQQAVLHCAVQCYAVEGIYPPDLSYMKENYGLIVNDKKYIVIYDAFASNLLPQVSVLAK